MTNVLTAGIILIGNELLSGDTPDLNLNYIAKALTKLGIQVKEAITIPDEEDEIIRVMRDYSKRFSYVISTGGIGPTHDDITAGAVAKAFNRPLRLYPEIMEGFEKKYGPSTDSLLHARQQMATLPDDAILIPQTVTTAPGFQVENVFVLAGVPIIMRSTMETVVHRLEKGRILYVRYVIMHVTEGKIAAGLANIQKQFPDVQIGSYPNWIHEHPDSLKITVKGYDASSVANAAQSIYDYCLPYDDNLELVET
jgi:molybdenum cofactor synthesis domain-containing protein